MFERSTMDARDVDTTHQCIAGRGCRAHTLNENNDKQPALTHKPHTLCDACTATHHDAIRRLLKDYAMLAITLGERRTRNNETVTSTPTPAILIDATSDRLMTEIVEWAEFAADIVTNSLNTEAPDGRRKLPRINLDGKLTEAQPDTVAANTAERIEPTEPQRLQAFLRVVEPHISVLAQQPKQDVQIWAQPHRCDKHRDQIIEAKRLLDLARSIADPDEIQDALNRLHAAHASAGICDDCCGWAETGQARQDAELSGLDVLNRLTRLHHLTRKHLGHTRLRHYYPMPCPRCGYPVGRDDGTTILNCENQECTPRGPSSWTEREYEYLTRLMTDDEAALQTTKWLLAESYSRLDDVKKMLTKIITKVGDGTVLDELAALVADHVGPLDRRIATDKAAAQQRQTAEDNWSWKRTKPYEKPGTKPRKPGPRVNTPSSLTTLTDINLDTTTPTAICPQCHLTRPCDCEN